MEILEEAALTLARLASSDESVCFISLGPTCVPAEILKACYLRTCTFGFDWCRSGSYHLQEFFRLGVNDFLLRHVYSPNIPLTQLDEPAHIATFTAEPTPAKPLYGFQYFLNPHRNIREPSTLEYHQRAFGRLAKVVYSKGVRKVFLLADYMNKRGSTFLLCPIEISEFVTKELHSAGVQNYSLKLIRFCLDDTDKHPILIQMNSIHPLSRLYTVKLDPVLDDPDIRKHMYRLVGKSAFAADLANATLWSDMQ